MKLIKECVVCKRRFESYNKSKMNHSDNRARRPFRSITCSKKCSLIHNHNIQHRSKKNMANTKKKRR